MSPTDKNAGSGKSDKNPNGGKHEKKDSKPKPPAVPPRPEKKRPRPGFSGGTQAF